MGCPEAAGCVVTLPLQQTRHSQHHRPSYHTVKKSPVPSREVTYQTLPGGNQFDEIPAGDGTIDNLFYSAEEILFQSKSARMRRRVARMPGRARHAGAVNAFEDKAAVNTHCRQFSNYVFPKKIQSGIISNINYIFPKQNYKVLSGIMIFYREV